MELAAGTSCSSSTSCVTHSTCNQDDENDKTCTCYPGFVTDITGLCSSNRHDSTGNLYIVTAIGSLSAEESWGSSRAQCLRLDCRKISQLESNPEFKQMPAGGSCSSSTSCVAHSTCKENDEGKTCSCYQGFVADDITGLCSE
ncbi:unnamed protein product [Darwinula stevensoni]|uniref:EGF-like domain-containing protein n=1 Tax=Darwinula stevensoni TaxID=69355 RepID=A0A7R9A8D9_9CRUS|nr:unnamed protein product [Darwinula stevensoni]CAG0896300.1 unnamed protein product [Darwinula stevensoni]